MSEVLNPNIGIKLVGDEEAMIKKIENMPRILHDSLSVLVYPKLGAWSNNVNTDNSWHIGNKHIVGTGNSVRGVITDVGFDISDGGIYIEVDGTVDKSYIVGFRNNTDRTDKVVLMIDNDQLSNGSVRLESTQIAMGDHYGVYSSSYEDGITLIGDKASIHNYTYFITDNTVQEILFIAEYDVVLTDEELNTELDKLKSSRLVIRNEFDGINLRGFPNTRPKVNAEGVLREFFTVDSELTDVFLLQPNKEYEIRHADGIDLVFVNSSSEVSLGMVINGSYLRIDPDRIPLPCKVKEVY